MRPLLRPCTPGARPLKTMEESSATQRPQFGYFVRCSDMWTADCRAQLADMCRGSVDGSHLCARSDPRARSGGRPWLEYLLDVGARFMGAARRSCKNRVHRCCLMGLDPSLEAWRGAARSTSEGRGLQRRTPHESDRLTRDRESRVTFDGLGAKEASSDAFVDNQGSNAISRGLGYEPNGSEWATRQGKPALLNRWRLTRDDWEQHRRDDIQPHSIEACHALLPLS